MIVRIMGKGQWEVPDELTIHLNVLDELVEDAVESRDGEALSATLAEMADLVVRNGEQLPPGRARWSDLIVPGAGSSLEEIFEWMQESRADDGLIPG